MGTKEKKDKKDKIQDGVEKYLEIMNLYSTTDFGVNSDFAKKFDAFCRVRRNEEWRKAFFDLFKEVSKEPAMADFRTILAELHTRLAKLNDAIHSTIEASFASKMLHTVNPDMPIWDSIVLSKLNLSEKVLPYKMNRLTTEARLNKCEEVYNELKKWYETDEATTLEAQFDKEYPEHKEDIGRTKKIDFMLWGKEDEPEKNVIHELLKKHFKDFGKKSWYTGFYADVPRTLDYTEYLLSLNDEDVKTGIWNSMTYKLENEFPELKPLVDSSEQYPLLKAFIKEREDAYYHFGPVNQPIEAERILLKPMPDGDAKFIFESIKQDHAIIPTFWNCYPDDSVIDESFSRAFLYRSRLAFFPGYFGIYLANVETPIGYVGLMEYAKNEHGKSIFNIEYYILPAYRHNGYAKDACRVVLQALADKRINGAKETTRNDVYTSEPFDPFLVLGRCQKENEASKHILESLGFVYDGLIYENHFRYDGELLQEHIFHLAFNEN